MIHELLLALSGHHSPLVDNTGDVAFQIKSSLSPSENALLRSIAQLGVLKSNTQIRASLISASHPSNVCRAVSSAILSVHLASFQEKILSVEKQILQQHATFVGAYDTVPLSIIAAAFEEWKQVLAWLGDFVQFIQPTERAKGGTNNGKGDNYASFPSGAAVIDRLRKEAQTGYPEVKRVAVHLSRIAEQAWLRHVSAWVMYGRLPNLGDRDFFIQNTGLEKKSRVSGQNSCTLDRRLRPSFVPLGSANSILFIGNCWRYIQARRPQASRPRMSSIDFRNAFLLSDIHELSSLEHPLSSASFSRIIYNIRSSFSRNVLQKILPTEEILRMLNLLRDFFLLERGEFAIAIIGAADKCLGERHQEILASKKHAEPHQLGGMMIKEGEVTAVLKRTWTALAALQNIESEDEDEDRDLEFARQLIHLSMKKHCRSADSPAFSSSGDAILKIKGITRTFDSVLLNTPVFLSVQIPAPLDLFLDSASVEIYSLIHTYLLSIRRAHLHLTDLWKFTNLRRVNPSPKRSSLPLRNTSELLNRKRESENQRLRDMRKVWASAGSATFFLAELGEYLQGEVVVSSWGQFKTWIDQSSPYEGRGKDTYGPKLSTLIVRSSQCQNEDSSFDHHNELHDAHDPESLTIAHCLYLNALVHSLLLDDKPFTDALKSLVMEVDHIVAFMKRLNVEQQSSNFTNEAIGGKVISEEKDMLNVLRDVTVSLGKALQCLVKRLQEIHSKRVGERVNFSILSSNSTSFMPFQGSGVYRLLMKLDFARFQGLEADVPL